MRDDLTVEGLCRFLRSHRIEQLAEFVREVPANTAAEREEKARILSTLAVEAKDAEAWERRAA